MYLSLYLPATSYLQLQITPNEGMKFTFSNWIISYNLKLEDPGIELKNFKHKVRRTTNSLYKFTSPKRGSTFICPPNGWLQKSWWELSTLCSFRHLEITNILYCSYLISGNMVETENIRVFLKAWSLRKSGKDWHYSKSWESNRLKKLMLTL